MIRVRNIYNDEIVKFNNVKEVLQNINRDRSAEWVNYDENDWQEGLEVFTEYRLLSGKGENNGKRIRS